MKQQTTIMSDRPAIGRSVTREQAIRANERAAQQAEIDGDFEEAKRRRDAVYDLKLGQRQTVIEPLPTWLVRDLGGVRDPIARLVKDRELSVVQAKAALILREHEEGEAVVVQTGDSGLILFVDGRIGSGLEALCDARARGREMWRLLRGSLSHRASMAVERMIRGKASMRQAARLYGGDTTKACKVLRSELRAGLDASLSYVGAFS